MRADRIRAAVSAAAIAGSLAAFVTVGVVTALQTSHLYTAESAPGLGTWKQRLALQIASSVIAWGMVVLPGVVLAGRGAGWWSLGPATAAALFAHSASVTPYQPFVVLLPGPEMLGLVVGWSVAVAGVAVLARSSLRKRIELPAGELLASALVAMVALVLLDRVLEITAPVPGARGLSWAFALSALTFAIAWDAEKASRIVVGATLMPVMHGAWFASLAYVVVYGDPVSGWQYLVSRDGAAVSAAIALLVPLLARFLVGLRGKGSRRIRRELIRPNEEAGRA